MGFELERSWSSCISDSEPEVGDKKVAVIIGDHCGVSTTQSTVCQSLSCSPWRRRCGRHEHNYSAVIEMWDFVSVLRLSATATAIKSYVRPNSQQETFVHVHGSCWAYCMFVCYYCTLLFSVGLHVDTDFLFLAYSFITIILQKISS